MQTPRSAYRIGVGGNRIANRMRARLDYKWALTAPSHLYCQELLMCKVSNLLAKQLAAVDLCAHLAFLPS